MLILLWPSVDSASRIAFLKIIIVTGECLCLRSKKKLKRRRSTTGCRRRRSRTRVCWELGVRSCATIWTSTGWLHRVMPSQINVSCTVGWLSNWKEKGKLVKVTKWISNLGDNENNNSLSEDEIANVNVYDDIVHVVARAYANWTDFLIVCQMHLTGYLTSTIVFYRTRVYQIQPRIGQNRHYYSLEIGYLVCLRNNRCLADHIYEPREKFLW